MDLFTFVPDNCFLKVIDFNVQPGCKFCSRYIHYKYSNVLYYLIFHFHIDITYCKEIFGFRKVQDIIYSLFFLETLLYS